MGNNWIPIKFGDLVDIRHGFAFQGEYFKETPTRDILVTPGNFAIGGGFKIDKVKYYDGPVPNGFVLKPGELLVTMTDLSKAADTLGFPAFVPQAKNGIQFLHNQRIGKVQIKPGADLDLKYLYYLLCSQSYRNEILASATGTTVKHTSPSRIGEFRFLRPKIEEQRAIGEFLEAFDQKIAINRKISETLEFTARTLFKSWFVNFEPVHAKINGGNNSLSAKISALFPDEFGDTAIGQSPAGWDVGNFGDVATNIRQNISASEIKSTDAYIALDNMPRGSLVLTDWEMGANIESNKSKFNKGDILFGKLRPYFRKVGIAPLNGICSTDIIVLNSKKREYYGFVVEIASSSLFIDFTSAASTGTKMPRTSWSDLARYKMIIPPEPLAARYNEIVQPMFERIITASHESVALASCRDKLLPKLILGEIRLKDAERHLEGVA